MQIVKSAKHAAILLSAFIGQRKGSNARCIGKVVPVP